MAWVVTRFLQTPHVICYAANFELYNLKHDPWQHGSQGGVRNAESGVPPDSDESTRLYEVKIFISSRPPGASFKKF